MIRAASSDVFESLKRIRLAFWLGFRETILPYRMAKIGPLWMTLSTGLWTLAICFLLGPTIGRGEPGYYVYVSVGMALYSTFQIFISDGSTTFVRSASLILNVPNPFFIYVIRIAAKAAIQIIVVCPIVVIAMFVAGQSITPAILYALPGLVLCSAFGIGVTLLLGSFAVRYRDLVFAVQALMRLLLFVTPIFWIVAERSGPRVLVAYVNPLYHLIEVVREPVLGQVPDPVHWFFAGLSAVLALLLGFLTFAWYRGRMAIWL